MRTLTVALIATGTLLGCSPANVPPTASTAAGSVHCIPLAQVAGRRPVANGAVLFEMVGPIDYRNRFRGGCPFLARLGSTATISVASGGEGGRLCSGDRVRVFDPMELQSQALTSAPICVLGEFEPVPRAAPGPNVSHP